MLERKNFTHENNAFKIFFHKNEYKNIIQYQMINPENMHANFIIWTETVEYMYLHMNVHVSNDEFKSS